MLGVGRKYFNQGGAGEVREETKDCKELGAYLTG